MLQCIVNITLQQLVPYVDSTGTTTVRNQTFKLDFCHSFEVYSSWNDLSDTATIEIPKNVYVQDANNKSKLWGDSTTPDKQKGYVNAGGFFGKVFIPTGLTTGMMINTTQVSSIPLIMRGDAVTITAGYSYISQVNADGSLTYFTPNPLVTVFTGYVSSLEMKSTLKIHCEDNMWLLKQVNMPDKTYYSPNNDISDVLEDVLAKVKEVYPNTNFTPDTNQFSLSVDGLSTGNETAAGTLNKLKKILPSMGFYFRGNTLRGGGSVYYSQDQALSYNASGDPVYNSFNFQKNIISDELHYSLLADVKVGAKCYSINLTDKGTQNKMMATQYQSTRVEAEVGVQPKDNPDGYEYFTFYFKDIATEKELTAKGNTYLARYQYDGFRGKFTTFGMPYIQHGNIITITDSLFPERNGNYMVKAVHYSFGVDSGLRQEIDLHFRTNNIDPSILEQGM